MRNTINVEFIRLRKVINSLSAKFLSGLLIAAILLPSCKKDTTDIGFDLPAGHQLTGMYTEALYVRTHTKRVDSLKTNLNSVLMCGNYYDPHVGVTSASFYAEAIPTVGTVNFGTLPKIDSVVLSLVYKGFFGDPAPLRFKVYQVVERLYRDSTYYSFEHKRIDVAPLADVTLEPNTIDSVHADGTTYGPQLRIKLDTAMLRGFLRASNYTTQSVWENYFSGIFVQALQTNLSGNRAIYSFDPNSAHTKITMYYKNSTDTLTNSYLLGGALPGRFNHFDHDYSTAPNIQNQLASNDTVNEDFVYVQGLAGLETKIYLPDLFTLTQDGDVAINKAELEVRVDPSTISSFFASPTQMVLVALDANEHYLTTPDLLEGTAYSGGTYDAVNKKYTFNIARYIQQVLSGKITDRGMMIVPQSSGVFANRAVLGGGKSTSPYRIRLKITYTKL